MTALAIETSQTGGVNLQTPRATLASQANNLDLQNSTSAKGLIAEIYQKEGKTDFRCVTPTQIRLS